MVRFCHFNKPWVKNGIWPNLTTNLHLIPYYEKKLIMKIALATVLNENAH